MKSQVTVTVTIEQAKEALAQTVEMYFAQDEQGNWRLGRNRARPVCLMGPTGIGKTEIVKQVAEEKELAFLSYSVTHHTRQSAIGLPRLTERQVDGKSVCVTEYTLSEIVAEVWRVMEETGKDRGILFLVKTPTLRAWSCPRSLSLRAIISPSLANATEQMSVPVSIHKIRLIVKIEN